MHVHVENEDKGKSVGMDMGARIITEGNLFNLDNYSCSQFLEVGLEDGKNLLLLGLTTHNQFI